MSNPKRHIVIIGGGVIGATAAYYLVKSNWQVTIIEKNQFGSGCSHANCGYVSPSHVLPLTEPGATTLALKAFLGKTSALRIHPKVAFQSWYWFWRFYRNCNQQKMIQSGHALKTILDSSRELYQELMDDGLLECEWETQGMLNVYRDSKQFEEFSKTKDFLQETFGSSPRRMDASELLSFEPALKEDVTGAWFHEEDAHLRPDKLLSEWQRVLTESEVEIREESAFEKLILKNDQLQAVKTSEDEIKCDAILLATGAWSAEFAKEFQCKIPVQPGKGYSMTMPRPKICPRVPMLLPERKVGVTPMQTGYRLGSTMEFAGYDTSIPESRLEYLKESAALYLHQPTAEPVEEKWYGWRPMTYDSLPIIDRVPAIPNAFIATGHNMLGLSQATATGKLITEIINKQSPHIDPQPYRVTRF